MKCRDCPGFASFKIYEEKSAKTSIYFVCGSHIPPKSVKVSRVKIDQNTK